MREIKFRGMDIDGRWFYGNLAVLTENVRHLKQGHYISNEVGMPFAYQVRPETVGQYTGLKDRNGKEIYEGDIVIVNCSHKALKANFEPDKSVVQWREKGACFDMLHAGYLNAERKVGLTFDNGMVDTIEVIGNIYEGESHAAGA